MGKLVDILDEFGKPTGRQGTADEVTTKGLWHGGVHGLIYTPNGSVIVQKRSSKIVFHPGKLDFSVGGFVDANETPLQAMIRETHEELGIVVPRSRVIFLGVFKYNHRWPSIGKIDRVFIYRYLIRLNRNSVDVRVQPSEVEWAKLIPLKEARKLVREGHDPSLGRLETTFSMYEHLLDDLATHLAVNG